MVDAMAWAELRESLREALDALETAKELIPWEDSFARRGYRCVCAARLDKSERRSRLSAMFLREAMQHDPGGRSFRGRWRSD